MGRRFDFYAPDKESIDDVIISLKDELLFEKEEDVAGFLGLQIKREAMSGKITLTQSGLIEWILEVMGMDESNHNTRC